MSQLAEEVRSPAPKPVAVIDIGTTSIRMAIAEIDDSGGVRILDTLAQAVNLGEDAFTSGRISKGSIEDCVHSQQTEDCRDSGGTTVTVQFYKAERFSNAPNGSE